MLLREGITVLNIIGEFDTALSGSETAAWYWKLLAGTWEIRFCPETKVEAASNKLANQQGRSEEQRRKSDLPIVAMKQGNACGAKGQAVSD